MVAAGLVEEAAVAILGEAEVVAVGLVVVEYLVVAIETSDRDHLKLQSFFRFYVIIEMVLSRFLTGSGLGSLASSNTMKGFLFGAGAVTAGYFFT